MTESKKTEDTKKVPSLAEITKKTEDTPKETATAKKVEEAKKTDEEVAATEDSEGHKVVNNILPSFGSKFEEVGEDHVDPEGMQDGRWLGEAPKSVAQKRQEWEAAGFVHQWEDNPQENLANKYDGTSALPDGVHPHQKRESKGND